MDSVFVQLSDLHLGRRFEGLNLPLELAEELRQASLATVQAAIQLAEERDAVAVLVAGDLFDRPEPEEAVFLAVQRAFAEFGRPVLVSPGNHDEFGPLSVWNRRALTALGLPAWSDNVHIFTTRSFTSMELESGLVVHGHRVEGYDAPGQGPLAAVRRTGAEREVVLMHGALVQPGFTRPTTLPFTAEALARAEMDYAAVGHYHQFRKIKHAGRLLGAYGGVPVPGERDEDPHGGVLVARVGARRAEVELVTPYAGRIVELRVEAGATEPFGAEDDVRKRVLDAARREQVGKPDLVFVRLEGFNSSELDIESLTAALGVEFRYVSLSDQTTPLVSLARRSGRITVEQQFLRRIEALVSESEDEEARRITENAGRLGVLALRGRRIVPPAAVLRPTSEGEFG